MSKKVLRLFSILFLSSILVLSCSNADKTGSGDNNSGNGGSSTGGSGSGTGDGGTGTGDGGTGDGGTTTQGIAKYAGTWTAKFNTDNNSYDIIIGSDGNVTIKDPSGKQIKAENIEGSGNTYTMKVQHSSSGIDASTVTITFTNETSGTINDTSDAFGAGVIRKQNGGNKGLWYYEGSWTLTPNQQPAQNAQNLTITIGNDGSVTFNGEKNISTLNKGNETYEVKFSPANEGESILTLTFTSDTEGTFVLSGSESGNGSMKKQKQ